MTIKEKILLDFGDQGAETFERYFLQIAYTAFWCIRMLRTAERIEAVIPEGIEDVTIIRNRVYELHQVKTRAEGQDPWTCAEVLPILCKLYHHRTAFDGECHFHFVSDYVADHKTVLRPPRAFGALYEVKNLLDIKHDKQPFRPDEATKFEDYVRAFIPVIQKTMQEQYGEIVDPPTARNLLANTWIETDDSILRRLNGSLRSTMVHVEELDEAFRDELMGLAPSSMAQLRATADRILVLTMRRIVQTGLLSERRVECSHVLDCRVDDDQSITDNPDLSNVPGVTILDKKLQLGGFDVTDLAPCRRQRRLADWLIRRLQALNLDYDLERLTVDLLDNQAQIRHNLCRREGQTHSVGPTILEKIRPILGSIERRYFPDDREVDDQFCLGVLWRETDLCNAWWSPYPSTGAAVA